MSAESCRVTGGWFGFQSRLGGQYAKAKLRPREKRRTRGLGVRALTPDVQNPKYLPIWRWWAGWKLACLFKACL